MSKDLTDLYQIRFEREFLPRKLAIWEVLCRSYFQTFIEKDATVVDVACGYGEFINHIKAANKIAVDLNAESRDRLHPEVEFHQISAERVSSIGAHRADVVFT